MQHEIQGTGVGTGVATGVRQQSIDIQGQLQMEKQRLEQRLVDINKALEILDKNPEFAELFNTLRGTIY